MCPKIMIIIGVCVVSFSAYATEQVIASENDPSSPAAKELAIPHSKQPPLIQPYVTDKWQKAALITPVPGENYTYSIIPSETEHSDPDDDSAVPANDVQWDLLSW